MKKNVHESDVKWGLFLRTLFLTPGALRIGIVHNESEKKFVVVQYNTEGDSVPLIWGETVPLWLRMIMPIITVSDAGELPVYMVSDEIGEGDPDEWIDRNEEQCLPPGFSVEKVATDYAVNNGRIVAVSADIGQRNELMEKLESSYTLSCITAPLQGMAQLLGTEERKRCIVWKLSRNGSIFSRVEDGVVTDTCTCWIPAQDVTDNTEEKIEQAGKIADSIAGEWNDYTVILLTDELFATVLEGVKIGKGKILLFNKMNALPSQYMEAFGNAITPDKYVQLLPFHKKQDTLKLHTGWSRCIDSVKILFVVLLIVLGIFGSYLGIITLLLNRDSASMEKIKKQHDTVKHAAASRDSLLLNLKKQTAFFRGESRITTLLNDLQTAIPEGAGLEELNVAEVSEDSWTVILHVRAKSSSAMQPFLDGISKLQGINDIRMVYSERGEDSSGKRMLLFKVEGQWR